MQQTLLLIKPLVSTGDHNQIVERIEQAGFKIKAMFYGEGSVKMWEEHYQEHRKKPFFTDLCADMANKEFMGYHLERDNAVVVLRDMNGATDPAEAAPGTLRHDFGKTKRWNAVHGSASVEEADRELALWFGKARIDPESLLEYTEENDL